MQVDIGDNQIHSNFVSIVRNRELRNVQLRLKASKTANNSSAPGENYSSQAVNRRLYADPARSCSSASYSSSTDSSRSSFVPLRPRDSGRSNRSQAHRRHQHHNSTKTTKQPRRRSRSVLSSGERHVSYSALPASARHTHHHLNGTAVSASGKQSSGAHHTRTPLTLAHSSAPLPQQAPTPAGAEPPPCSHQRTDCVVREERRRGSRHAVRNSSRGRMSNSARAPANGTGNGRPHDDDVDEDDGRGSVHNDDQNERDSNKRKEGTAAQQQQQQQQPQSPKPGPKLAQTKIQLGMRLKRWMVISRIGAGSFGETFSAIDVEGKIPPLSPSEDPLTISPEAKTLLSNLPDESERKEVCIKVEQENKNVLRLEALALKKVQPCAQVVRYLGSGCTNGMNFLVMQKLGPNLAELRRRSPHGTFNIYTTLKAGISCLTAIRGVHDQGLVHRDIKPSNFVTGLVSDNDQATCYIIDFGLARRYRRSNGEIRPPRDNAGFRGTSRYASVTSHHHQELGRVDDLWSLLFMLVEFATGTLPWRKYKDKDEIGRCKEESITPHLVRNLPREFQPFLAHLHTLRYEDEPDYDLLLALMQRSLERRGYPVDKPVDWELDPSMIEAADAEMAQSPRPPQASAIKAPSETKVDGAERNGGPTGLPRRPSSTPASGADGSNKNGPTAANRAGADGSPPAQAQEPQKEDDAKASSSGSSVAGEKPQPAQTNGVDVNDVEMSYQRSQKNEDARSGAGAGVPPLANGTAKDNGSVRRMSQIDMTSPQRGRASVAVTPRANMADDDGSDTPAAQASSTAGLRDFDGEDHDFSPREMDEEAHAKSRAASAVGSGDGARATKAGTNKASSGGAGCSAVQSDRHAAAPSPLPVSSDERSQSLDAMEERARDRHPPPPPPIAQPRPPVQNESKKQPPPAEKAKPAERKEKDTSKTPKSKSKCTCTAM